MDDIMQGTSLSPPDIRLLRLIQRDWSKSRQTLADAAGMSASTLWRRLTDLQRSGAIRKRVALLDPIIADLPVCVFLSVNLVNYDAATREAFETFVGITPEIMECFSVTGEFDYMLIVRSKSVIAFEQFLMERILGQKSVASASSQISLREHKYSTELPL